LELLSVELEPTVLICRAVDWYDPNSVLENNVTSAHCSSDWTWDGVTSVGSEKNTYNTNYAICLASGETYFEMRFLSFASPKNFSLEIAHHYEDTRYVCRHVKSLVLATTADQSGRDFPVPWNYPTIFAMPEFSLKQRLSNNSSMSYFDPGPISFVNSNSYLNPTCL
jgi:hypothetical protein